jgi:predicted Zn-dependent peptidase
MQKVNTMIDAKTRYDYKTVPNDLMNVLQYTLSNGLQLFLSVNKNEPRIFTNIAVRAGSKQDPADTTGLAHYMEHMLFKGTSKIGTLDWDKEKVLLEQISDLYERHRQATSEDQRAEIYKKIDEVSFEAAKMAAPSEYDKLLSQIGAQATNAYTWVEQTVYVNDIPSNEVERWMRLESERFRMMALRLFHTELETVYEEFNIGQDSDNRKIFTAIRKGLYPNHPYGTQTTIGSAEHLRNPSQVNIQRYFQTYYVPNNMAIVMAGDFDPDEIVALAERYFGDYEPKPVPPFNYVEEPSINAPQKMLVYGQETDSLTLAWRLGPAKSQDSLIGQLVVHLLYNQQAGFIDLNINQQQKALEASAWAWSYHDYGAFGLSGKPRQGQSLDELRDLLLGELDRLRNGELEDWLLEGVILDYKLGQLHSIESNDARVGAMTSAFILGLPWERYGNRLEEISNISKDQIFEFVRTHLKYNYVEVHKLQGEDPAVIKVEKPPITAVELNRDAVSDFAKAFLAEEVPGIEPVFVDYETAIQTQVLSNGLKFDYVYNPSNPIFRLEYIFELGKNHDRKLALALQYFSYLGTTKYSNTELQKEIYRLGVTIDFNNDDERTYISITGLEDKVEQSIQLLEHIWAELEPNAETLQTEIEDILTRRANSKQDRNYIFRTAMGNYARYGTESPFFDRLSEAQLKATTPEELVQRIKDLRDYEHVVYYYGQKPAREIAALIEKHHQTPAVFKKANPARKFNFLDTTENRVLFLDHPMVQCDVMLLSKGTPQFNLYEDLMADVYNEYFGLGLSSIVFQEIRESKALAYATYAYYSSPRKLHQPHYLQAYVGTQPDKLSDAIPTFLDLLENMPVVDSQIENARQSMLKNIETDRVVPSRIYSSLRASLDTGLSHDTRRDSYELLQNLTPQKLLEFQEQYVKGRNYTFVVLGSKEGVDLDYLAQFGNLEELSIEQVFGY